ncbi:MFS transporter [Kineococcus indalonis]|uniref:MFS transporter n=1 Tax=Kineococcus indalonis TaxID=2696566 RepID=UPI002B1BDCC8|nr:MFS transporter [Kineococcus indalonis]
MAGCFFLNAVFYASLVPRLPELRDGLGIGNATLGIAIAALPLGSFLAAPLSSVLLRRFGSASTACSGLVLLALALCAAVSAPSWPLLAVAFFCAGIVDALVDVAQNAHGLRVQRAYGRSILNSFHGLWSVGAAAGAGWGSAAAALAVPLVSQVWLSAALFVVVALLLQRWMLPGPDRPAAQRPSGEPGEPGEDHEHGEHGEPSGASTGRSRVVVVLLALGLIAACGSVVEDAGSSWSAIYLRDELSTSAGVAGSGYLALMVAMTVARLTGDRVVDRYGQRRVARAGGAVTAAGMALALAWPSVPSTLLGFALAGAGVATLIPAAFHAADELPGLPHGLGLSLVNWAMRVGFLLSPPVIGFIADSTSVRTGLVATVVAGLATVVLGRFLAPRPAR